MQQKSEKRNGISVVWIALGFTLALNLVALAFSYGNTQGTLTGLERRMVMVEGKLDQLILNSLRR